MLTLVGDDERWKIDVDLEEKVELEVAKDEEDEIEEAQNRPEGERER